MQGFLCMLCGTFHGNKEHRLQSRVKCSNECLDLILKSSYRVGQIISIQRKDDPAKGTYYCRISQIKVVSDVTGSKHVEIRLEELSVERVNERMEIIEEAGFDRLEELRNTISGTDSGNGYWQDTTRLKRFYSVKLITKRVKNPVTNRK